MRNQEGREIFTAIGWYAVVASLVVLTLPIVLVLVMLVVSPTYVEPMVRQPLGLALLGFGVVVLALGYGATYAAVRMLRAGRPTWVFLVVVATTIFCAFPTLWVVLLGPALLILLQPRS